MDLATDPFPGAELHRALARLRDAGPVGEVTFAGKTAWLVAGHAALTAAFKDEVSFPAGEWYRRAIEPTQGRTFESMDGAEHHLYRRLATPAFRSRHVARMEASGLAALAHELVDDFADARELDLVAAYTTRFPFLVISRVLGVPRERESEFVGWALGILRFDAGAARQFTEYLAPAIAERRAEPRDDVLSELLHVEVEGRRLAEEEVVSHIRLLFSAGATTTHDALGNLLWALFTHPDELAAVRADPSRLPAAIEELFRWETPVAVLPRLCLPGASLGGVEIPPESQALFAIAAANRDPAVFDDPDSFDPDRDTRRKLSFGLGSHSCPGLHLARANVRVATSVLLERLPELSLLDEPAARPRGATIRGPAALPVRIGPVPSRARVV